MAIRVAHVRQSIGPLSTLGSVLSDLFLLVLLVLRLLCFHHGNGVHCHFTS